MRKITMVFLLLAALLVSLSANAQRAAADNLLTECQQVSKALDAKHPNQYANQGEASFSAGQCEGYLQGWVESADGSYRVTKEGKVILVHVDIGSIKSYWDIAVRCKKISVITRSTKAKPQTRFSRRFSSTPAYCTMNRSSCRYR